MCCKGCCVQAPWIPLESTALLTKNKSIYLFCPRVFKAIAGCSTHCYLRSCGKGEIKAIDSCTRFAVGSILLMTTNRVTAWLPLAAQGERH